MILKQDCVFEGHGSRPLHIHLPDDYDQSQERYPVMYFFDGHNLYRDEDATYGKSWGLETYLQNWNKKMIIVGMECGHGDGERLSEYMPFRAFRGMFSAYRPQGEATMNWIINTVKPRIDREFRTIPWRECTGIAGSSMGGLMAIYAVTHFNSYFSKAACLSSALGFCAPLVFSDINRSEISPDTRVYLSWGTMEVRGLENPWEVDKKSAQYRRNKAVANKIEGRGGAAKLFCQVGGAHCEADWEKQIPEFMPFLWQS